MHTTPVYFIYILLTPYFPYTKTPCHVWNNIWLTRTPYDMKQHIYVFTLITSSPSPFILLSPDLKTCSYTDIHIVFDTHNYPMHTKSIIKTPYTCTHTFHIYHTQAHAYCPMHYIKSHIYKPYIHFFNSVLPSFSTWVIYSRF